MKFSIVFFLGLILFLLPPRPAAADQLEDGLNAFYANNYDTAYKLLIPAAKHGSAEAQEKIGEMYLFGLGVNKYCDKAMEWLTKSANQRYIYASHLLGRVYDDSRCGEKNNIKAYMWYTIAESELPKDAALAPEYLETYEIAGIKAPTVAKNWTLINRLAVDRKILSEVMTADEIAEAKRLAKEWKPEKDDDEDDDNESGTP